MVDDSIVVLENIYRMHQGIDQVNLVYNGQKLGIHADINDEALEHYPIFLDHDINLKITSRFIKF